MTDVNEGTMTINLAPATAVYSPHVRVLKDFVENVAELASEVTKQRGDPATLADGFGPIETAMELAAYVEGALDKVVEAAGRMLTDDFMLIVDGKRLPGGARSDI